MNFWQKPRRKMVLPLIYQITFLPWPRKKAADGLSTAGWSSTTKANPHGSTNLILPSLTHGIISISLQMLLILFKEQNSLTILLRVSFELIILTVLFPKQNLPHGSRNCMIRMILLKTVNGILTAATPILPAANPPAITNTQPVPPGFRPNTMIPRKRSTLIILAGFL